MPTRDTAPAGAPCWVDLLTSDPERSRDFYGQVFGWTATDPGEQFGGYFNFSKDGVLVAGGMPRQPGVEAPETRAGRRSACGSPACTKASEFSARRGPPPGSRSTPGTTRPPSPSTGTCSAG